MNTGVNKLRIIILAVILIILMVCSITLGAIRIPINDTARVILNKALRLGDIIDISNIKESNVFIIMNIRLPRIVMASLVGGILALVGASLQAIFKNPMADPYVMGVSSGAAFGATIGIILGFNKSIWGFGLTSLMAFIGAITTVILVYNLASGVGKISTTSILLAGIVMSSILSAGISIMMIFNHDELASIVSWTMGSFNGANWKQILVVIIPSVVGVILLLSLSRELNAIGMGEDDAQSLGVNVEIVKRLVLITTSLLAASAVSVSGIIGFVGLIIPHLFRLIFGSDHRILLPVSFLGGGIFLLICDTLARTVVNGIEIPVGAITAFFGGPFFLYLLRKSREKNFI